MGSPSRVWVGVRRRLTQLNTGVNAVDYDVYDTVMTVPKTRRDTPRAAARAIPARTNAGRRPSRPARAARGSLSREKLTAAALQIVDASGLQALSMRSLGAALGVDPTAVYRYFRTKDELLDALADAVVGGGGPYPETGDARQRLRGAFANLRHTLLAHPALTAVIVRRPPQGEATWQASENVLAILRGAGLSDADTAAHYQALLFYTLGHALLEAPFAATRPPQAHTAADEQAQARDTLAMLPAGRYPNLTAVAPRFYTDMEAQFLHGLDLMLTAMPPDT